MTTRQVQVSLLAITLISYLVRVWGIQFGLPFEYHPDEQQYLFPAVQVVWGDFQPHAHYNPAFYPYLLGAVFSATYWGLYLFGAFPETFNLELAWSDAMLPWTTGMIFLARYITVSVGVLTSLLVYHLGRRAYNRQVGLGAALIFGATFLPAREAHFAVSDTPVALGVTVTLYLCLAILQRGRWTDYLKTGIALGLTSAIKYNAGLLVIPISAAHLLSYRYSNWFDRFKQSWLLLMTGTVSLLSYSLVSPYTIIEYEKFWANFSENLESARTGFQGLALDPDGGLLFYLKTFVWGFGWPLSLTFIIASLFLLWRHRRIDLLMLIFPLFGLFYMQRQAMYFARWLMPFIPPLAVISAEGIWQVSRLVGQSFSQAVKQSGSQVIEQSNNQTATNQPSYPVSRIPYPVSPTPYSLLLFLLIIPSTITALYANYLFSQPDTRTETLYWVQQTIPPGSSIAAELLSPPWGPPLAMPGLSNIGPYQFAPVPDGGIAELPLEQYQAWGVQYLIASSYHYARPLLDDAHQAKLEHNLQTIHDNSELIMVFQPYTAGYEGYFYHDQVYGPANDTFYRHQPGPIIQVYRLY